MTLSEIAEATRITTRFLKAIEADNFSVLPGGIFTRSFIRAYARHVGMSEDDAIRLYHLQVAPTPLETEQAGEVEPPVKISERAPQPLPISASATTRTNWPAIAIGLAIIGIIAVLIYVLVARLNEEEPPQPTSPQTQSTPQQPSPPATQQSVASANTKGSNAGIISAEEAIVIRLQATGGDCWIRYEVDEAPSTSMTLKEGNTAELPAAQRQVKLNIGNRRTLDFFINDRKGAFPPDTPNFGAEVTISRDNVATFLQQ